MLDKDELIEGLHEGIIASGSILHYLSETQHNKIQHISYWQCVESYRASKLYH